MSASSEIIHVAFYNYSTKCPDWVAEIYGLPIKWPFYLPKVIPSWTLSYTIKHLPAVGKLSPFCMAINFMHLLGKDPGLESVIICIRLIASRKGFLCSKCKMNNIPLQSFGIWG